MDKHARHLANRLVRRLIQTAGSRLYVDRRDDLQNCIFVAGSARSGTTWLADIIASQVSCRILFEPFQSLLVDDYGDFYYFQYMRPNGENGPLHAFADKVLRGKIRNRWIDHRNQRLFPKYRLIKEIRANLLLKWLHDRFPEVPILFILRHPCAVVLSRLELGWATDADIGPFLKQPELVTDFLKDKLELIKSAVSDEEKHAIIWCISNLVPLTQFKESGLKRIHYEHLVAEPDSELSSVFKYIGLPYERSSMNPLTAPSLTARRTSAVVTGEDRISRWKEYLTPAQIDRILRVVDSFGLTVIYTDALLPLVL